MGVSTYVFSCDLAAEYTVIRSYLHDWKGRVLLSVTDNHLVKLNCVVGLAWPVWQHYNDWLFSKLIRQSMGLSRQCHSAEETPSTVLRHPSFNNLQVLVYDIFGGRCRKAMWGEGGVPESDGVWVQGNSGKHWFTTDILPPETAARRERVPLVAVT